MTRFESWFATSPLASALRVFAATVIALAVAAWVESGTISLAQWETWTIAALASSVPVVLRALNPLDGVYGRNGEPVEYADIWDEDDDL
jgi:hypothetical protein